MNSLKAVMERLSSERFTADAVERELRRVYDAFHAAVDDSLLCCAQCSLKNECAGYRLNKTTPETCTTVKLHEYMGGY